MKPTSKVREWLRADLTNPIHPTIIEIENPKRFAGKKVLGQRVPIGAPGDYKPCVAKLPGGELLLVAFLPGELGFGKAREEILLFRSQDGGATWSRAENLTVSQGLLGREPYLTVLRDGTMLMTVHLLAEDVRNRAGYTQVFVHRSEDGGRRWSTTEIIMQSLPPSHCLQTTRNILPLSDDSLLLGVSAYGLDRHEVWRSNDQGRSWTTTQEARFVGHPQDYPYGLFGEAWLRQLSSGKLFAVARVDHRFYPLPGTPPPNDANDQFMHMMLWSSDDVGRTWTRDRDLGGYGQMYPSIVKLRDGRLLLPYTQRAIHSRLGVRAVIGNETKDDMDFDWEHDRILLDTRTTHANSGGGFGPTVQLDDGTLVTSYSYRDREGVTHMEVVRWRLPD